MFCRSWTCAVQWSVFVLHPGECWSCQCKGRDWSGETCLGFVLKLFDADEGTPDLKQDWLQIVATLTHVVCGLEHINQLVIHRHNQY